MSIEDWWKGGEGYSLDGEYFGSTIAEAYLLPRIIGFERPL
tara:strand:+ start:3209 stop:3331 length:123 start_codon:yes stop_codon:yes gene_type:complete